MPDHLDPSRREFIAASALGILGFANFGRGAGSRSDSELLYVGTYTEDKRTEGIFLVRFDTRSGELHLDRGVDAGPNPSFLAIHPNGRVLYAVNEVDQRNGKASGAVSAFAIASDTGTLTRINEQASEGGSPCYVSVDRSGRAVLVANYVGGSIAMLPIARDGSLGAAIGVDQHRGKGPNAERQEAPHAHCIVTEPWNHFAFATDLGLDTVFVYRIDVDGGALTIVDDADGHVKAGAGPRHLAFHPQLPIVYVVNELDSTITTFRLARGAGALTPIATHSTLPVGWTGSSFAADLHVAPSGRVLYTSNRGHNSIAVFSIDESSGAPALEQTISTGGDWPRNFTLDPTGRWLLVGNQNSGSIVVLARDEKTGKLSPTQQRIQLPSPVCVRFRAHVGVTT
ncbi:MAG TPA: lactonase family protein [Gemmatimonadaceae bacterium]|jgi:6-phosphogluconolactonase